MLIQGELSGPRFGNLTLGKFQRLSYHGKQMGWTRNELEAVYKKSVSKGEDMDVMELYKAMRTLCKPKMDDQLEKVLSSLKS